MLLLYFEGVGVITGFAIGYFWNRVNKEINPLVRKRTILGFLISVVAAIVLGFIWYALTIPGGDWVLVKNCIMGFLGLTTVGWAFGMFAEWLVGKYFL